LPVQKTRVGGVRAWPKQYFLLDCGLWGDHL
jgi:hypothetical protein